MQFQQKPVQNAAYPVQYQSRAILKYFYESIDLMLSKQKNGGDEDNGSLVKTNTKFAPTKCIYFESDL